MTPADITDDIPRTAKALWSAAEAAGWAAWATWASGTPTDRNGAPQRVTERRETGELTDAGRPRIEIVTTDELLVIHSLAIRLQRGDARLCAIWEDGAFAFGVRQSPFRKINARQITELIKENA